MLGTTPLKVYPNPAADQLLASFGENPYTLSVYNSMGTFMHIAKVNGR